MHSTTQQELEKLKKEIHILKGRLQNHSKSLAITAKNQLESLEKNVSDLQRIIYTLTLNYSLPQTEEEDQKVVEILRRATLTYCKSSNIKRDLWKNIES